MHTHEKSHFFLKGARIAGLAVLGIITITTLALVFGLFVQWLWNWLMPSIFRLPTITYWQAFGLIVLAKLIFGTVGHHPGHHGPRHHFKHYHDHHHSPCSEDWDNQNYRLKGGWHNWDYYHEWWRKEGKDAFEKYIERSTTNNQDNQNSGSE